MLKERVEQFLQKEDALIPEIEAAITPLLDGVNGTAILGVVSAVCVRTFIRTAGYLTDSEKQALLKNRIVMSSLQLACCRAITRAIVDIKMSSNVRPDATVGEPPVPVAGGNDEGSTNQQ